MIKRITAKTLSKIIKGHYILHIKAITQITITEVKAIASLYILASPKSAIFA